MTAEALWGTPVTKPRPQGGGRVSRSVAERLLSKLIITPDCWLWAGRHDSAGYGRMDRARSIHRTTYEMYVGPIPDDLELDHLCRNHGCCNPAHLEPVTHAENVRRGESGIAGKSRTHCPQGHPYDEQNTYLRPDRPGNRDCRICMSERVRKHRRSWIGMPEVAAA